MEAIFFFTFKFYMCDAYLNPILALRGFNWTGGIAAELIAE